MPLLVEALPRRSGLWHTDEYEVMLCGGHHFENQMASSRWLECQSQCTLAPLHLEKGSTLNIRKKLKLLGQVTVVETSLLSHGDEQPLVDMRFELSL
ncbi:hypothetical protein UY3_13672 [Chelonia mydas]|uniref:Uncharacterized protein n=1 Tax=Chelonia mydas TaxID=8469 RepID=M7BLZ8_CHEMY|nr:hypothetical protein UY3_13672 [Chelonia mydas]